MKRKRQIDRTVSSEPSMSDWSSFTILRTPEQVSEARQRAAAFDRRNIEIIEARLKRNEAES